MMTSFLMQILIFLYPQGISWASFISYELYVNMDKEMNKYFFWFSNDTCLLAQLYRIIFYAGFVYRRQFWLRQYPQ